MRVVADQLVAPALLEVCCCLLISAVLRSDALPAQPHLVFVTQTA
jgi:hypothetical protein